MADYVLDPSNGGIIFTSVVVDGAWQVTRVVTGTIDLTPSVQGRLSVWDAYADVAVELTGNFNPDVVEPAEILAAVDGDWLLTWRETIDVNAAVDGALSEWDTFIDVSPVLLVGFDLGLSETIDLTPTIDGRLGVWQDINVQVEIDGSLEKLYDFTATIDVVPVLTGKFSTNFLAVIDVPVVLDLTWLFADALVLDVFPALTAAWNLTTSFGPIDVTAVIEGTWIVTRVKQVLTREDRARETEIRPSTPVHVYLLDAVEQDDLSVVPDNGGFLVSPLYNPNDHDPYFDQRGAKPNAIGEKVVIRNTSGVITNQTLVFRDPEPLEVVAYIGSLELYRYERDGAWRLYASVPQRALEGTRAFDSLDEDKIYDYYATLLGAMYAQWSYDNYFLARAYDPFATPPGILPYLASQYGLRVTEQESEAQKRSKIALAIPTFKLKGLVQGIQLRLFALGYRADVFEVWVWPDNPERFKNVPNDSWAAYDWSAAPGAGSVTVLGSAGSVVTFAGNVTAFWFPGDLIQIREPGGVTGPVFQAQTVTFTGGGTDVDFGTPVGTLPSPAEGVNVIPSWIAVPHGFFIGEPDFYYPTSRIIITLTDLDGDPIDSVPSAFLERNPGATLNEFWEYLAEDIGPDVMPVHDDIKAFGVISGDGRDGRRAEAEEVVYVTDDFLVRNLSSFTATIDVAAEVLGSMPKSTVWAPAPINIVPVLQGGMLHGQVWSPAPIDVAVVLDGDMPVVSPGPAPTLVWYNFDETPDTDPNLIDQSVNGFDSTLSGVIDRGDGALIIDATAASQEGGQSVGTFPGSVEDPPIAMTCWVKPFLRTDRNVMGTYALTPYPPNVLSTDYGSPGYGMGLNVWSAAGPYVAGHALAVFGHDLNIQVPGGITPDQWYFIAFSTGAVYGTRVWVNLDIVDTGPIINPTGSIASSLFTGRHNNDTAYGSRLNFWGDLDEARVYDRELTEEEIEAIFLYGRSIPPIFLMSGGGYALSGGGYAVVGGP